MPTKRLFIQAILSLSILGLTPFAQAMYIDRAIVDFLPDQARQDVKVINDGDENLYVQIDVLEVSNPGTEEETRTKITDPDSISLLVTPAKMVVPPNSSKLLRMVNLDENLNEEKIFRVNVTPILPPLSENDDTQVRLVVAYQVLVLVAPENPKYELESARQGKTLTLKNTGNSYVMMNEGLQCTKPEDETSCQKIPARRLYPGNEAVIDLPLDQAVELSLQSIEGNEKVVVE